MILETFFIDDNLSNQDDGAIEVTIVLKDGRKRWCFFMTPTALERVGDFIPNTNIRIHYGACHMIVVNRLDELVIKQVIELLDTEGKLEACTIPLK